MNEMMKEVKKVKVERFDEAQESVKEGEGNGYVEMAKDGGDMVEDERWFGIKVDGYGRDDD
ncbi:hypothetical protein, partial [Bacillus altitudinis]|uniref:hypothetical protein n=1 Tax=Bacillus altitudinis TaxID=293387 RepID=UPI003B527CA4